MMKHSKKIVLRYKRVRPIVNTIDSKKFNY